MRGTSVGRNGSHAGASARSYAGRNGPNTPLVQDTAGSRIDPIEVRVDLPWDYTLPDTAVQIIASMLRAAMKI